MVRRVLPLLDIGYNGTMILDTTLRDGLKASAFNPSFEEKISIATLLDANEVDVIECGYVIDKADDLEVANALSSTLEYASVGVLCSCDIASVELAYEAIKQAKRPFLNIAISLGEYLPPYQSHTTPEAIFTHTLDVIYAASELCESVQFSAMDATRANRAFLLKVAKQLSRYGASHISLADTMGIATPKLLNELINTLTSAIDSKETIFSLHAHNDNELANANAKVALSCGIQQIEGTIGGIGERKGNTNSMEIMRHLAKAISPELEALEKGYIKRYM